MATGTIIKPNTSNLKTKTEQVGSNASTTFVLTGPYQETIIFIYRSYLAQSGLYMSDAWGLVNAIVPATNVTVTKTADSANLVITNNNSFAVRVRFIEQTP